MFGKKLLGIVCLLFAGSQLVSAEKSAAPTINDCENNEASTECGHDTVADNFCYSNKKIYAINKSEDCYKVQSDELTNSEVNIFTVTLGSIVEASGIDGSDLSSSISDFVIYNCDEEGCERSYGFLKNQSKYFYIGSDGQNEVITPEVATCSGNIGLLDANNKLCLGYDTVDISTSFAEKSYFVLSGTTNAGNPFTADAAAVNIPIQVGTNYMIKDTLFEEDLYSEYGTNKLIERKKNFCEGTILNTFNSCIGGSCTVTPNSYTTGTYIIADKVYNCEDNKCNFNGGVSGLQAFNYNCAEDKTYAELIGNDGFANLTSDDLINIKLYDCNAGVCTDVTTGYIKYNASSLAKCYTGTEGQENGVYACRDILSILNSGETGCSATEVGNFDSNESKLCVHKIDGNYEYLEIGNDTDYYISVSTTETEYVKYTSSSNGKILAETELADGDYIIADNHLITVKGNASDTFIHCDTSCTGSVTPTVGYYLNGDLANKKLIYCSSGEGISCELIDTLGYYSHATASSTYMKCNIDGNCEKLGDLEDCTNDTIGDLTNGGKLCLDNGKQSGTFNNEVSYYIVKYREDNLFDVSIGETQFITDAEKYGIIKIDGNSMTFDGEHATTIRVTDDLLVTTRDNDGDKDYTCNASGICIFGSITLCDLQTGQQCDANNYYLVNSGTPSKTIVSAKDTNGYLYFCQQSTNTRKRNGIECNQVSVSGYYIKSDNEIYSCNGIVGQCQRRGLEGNCSSSTIGQLFKDDDEEISLCLNHDGESTGTPVKVTNNNGRYIIAYDETKNIFGLSASESNTHGLIKIIDIPEIAGAKKIILDAEYYGLSPLGEYAFTKRETNEILVRGLCSDNVDEYNCDESAKCVQLNAA